VVEFIDLLGEALRSIRQGSDPRLELELVLIKVTAPGIGPARPTVDAGLTATPRPPVAPAMPVVPAQVRESPVTAPVAPTATPAASSDAAPTAAPKTAATAEATLQGETANDPADSATAASPDTPAPGRVKPDLDHIRRAWLVVVEAVRKRQTSLAAVLAEGQPESLDGDELVIAFPAGYSFQADQVTHGDNPRVVREALREVTGKDLRITTRLASGTALPAAAAEEDARILSNDELIRALKQVFDAEVIDDGPSR
jgi:DNA polymerase III gamma/tau subunit